MYTHVCWRLRWLPVVGNVFSLLLAICSVYCWNVSRCTNFYMAHFVIFYRRTAVWLDPVAVEFVDELRRISMASKSSSDQSRRRRIFAAPSLSHIISSFATQSLKIGLFECCFISSFTTTNYNSKLQQFNSQWSTNSNVWPDTLQSNRPSRDVFPSCFRQIDGLINQAVISRVAIAVEKLSLRSRRKQRQASTNQSNNFGVNSKRKRFKPSTPGLGLTATIKWICYVMLQRVTCIVPSVLWRCWLGGRKGIRPVKKLSGGVLAWLSVWR